MSGKKLIIIEGPPAAGKSTVTDLLGKKLKSPTCRYKRLGFANKVAEFLMNISNLGRPSYKKTNLDLEDPILKLDKAFSRKISQLIFLMEILYKFSQYVKIFLIIAINKILVVDEGPSLGWANYYNLMGNGMLSLSQVHLLRRLDIKGLNFLSKLAKIEIIYIDQNNEKLNNFWEKRGHKKDYPIKFAVQVRKVHKMLRKETRKNPQIKIMGFDQVKLLWERNPTQAGGDLK